MAPIAGGEGVEVAERVGTDWDLAVSVAGEGPPVVLLHGLLTDSRVWTPLVAALEKDHTVVTIDTPGHGASPPRGAYALDEEVAALLSTVDGLGLGRATWVGHSAGGMKALRVALARPEDVSALVLVSTQPYAEPERTARPYLAMVEAATSWGVSEDLAELMGRLNFGPSFLDTPAGREWVAHFRTVSGEAIAAPCTAVYTRDDISARLPSLTVPTLVVHGAADIPIRLRIAREYAALLPHGELVVLPDCGHTPPVERPRELAAAVRRFLS